MQTLVPFVLLLIAAAVIILHLERDRQRLLAELLRRTVTPEQVLVERIREVPKPQIQSHPAMDDQYEALLEERRRMLMGERTEDALDY